MGTLGRLLKSTAYSIGATGFPSARKHTSILSRTFCKAQHPACQIHSCLPVCLWSASHCDRGTDYNDRIMLCGALLSRYYTPSCLLGHAKGTAQSTGAVQ